MCLRKDSLCYFNTCIFPVLFLISYLVTEGRRKRRFLRQNPIFYVFKQRRKVHRVHLLFKMVFYNDGIFGFLMPLSKFFGELPVFALKGTAFCRESKEKRSASNFLLSVLKSCWRVTPVVYSFFRRHIYRHRPLSLTFQFSISLRDCFLRKREMFTSSIYSHRVF